MQQVPKKLDSLTGEITKVKVYPKFLLENISNDVSKSAKKLKFKKRERVIFGLIRDDSSNRITILNEVPKEQPGGKKDSRRKKKESSFNTGRWHPEEHQRFIEALLKYGNDWKSVQRYVGSRSSTQARSHAQKFFVKIGKTQIENLQLDFENNSLKSLNIMANNLNNDQMARAIKSLNELAFDKKNSGRKNGKSAKLESPFGKFDTFNFDNSQSEDDGSLFFSNHSAHHQEKMMSQYSTSGEGNSAGFKMTKR
jgi:SHAQKYF class myb-like DNA-binding protein